MFGIVLAQHVLSVNLDEWTDEQVNTLKSTPPGLGKLKSLQTLTHFILAKDGGSEIKVLGELCDLRGDLSIEGLDNVCTTGDAKAANLEFKRHLSSLMLQWSSATRSVQHSEISILEKLRPPANLRELTIRSYGGPRFPDWLTSDEFINVSVLNVEDCKNCTSLPPIGQLRSLKKLLIKGLDKVASVGLELNGDQPEVFQSLEYLEIDDMKNLQEWVSYEGIREGESFPRLQKLKITKCPVLRRALPSSLPLLSELIIEGCPLLEAAALWVPCLCLLDLQDNDKASQPVRDFSRKSSIHIQCTNMTDGLSIPPRSFPPSTTTLEVRGLSNLDVLMDRSSESLQACSIESCDGLRSFPLHMFPSLKDIYLGFNENLESLSLSDGFTPVHLNSLSILGSSDLFSFPRGGLRAPSLTSLMLLKCHGLKSLPENMRTLLPSLRVLVLQFCKELEGFPDGGLPPKLVELRVRDCRKLTDRWEEWGLQSLCSLELLLVEEVKPFPEEGMLPASLTSLTVHFRDMKCLNVEALEELPGLRELHISGDSFESFPAERKVLAMPSSLTTLTLDCLQGLESLEDIGIQNLTCLQELHISLCGITSMPAKGLPESLRVLSIGQCPVGRKLCLKKGKDWSRVSHVPSISIDGELLT